MVDKFIKIERTKLLWESKDTSFWDIEWEKDIWRSAGSFKKNGNRNKIKK